MIRNNIVTYAGTVGGLLLVLAGLLGFVTPNLLGLHLNALTSLAHLASGILALYFGLKSPSLFAARTFCQVIGFVYAFAGLVGLVNALSMGSGEAGRQIAQHAAHLMLGIAFMAAAMVQPLRPAGFFLGINRVKGRS